MAASWGNSWGMLATSLPPSPVTITLLWDGNNWVLTNWAAVSYPTTWGTAGWGTGSW
jgi:hypothetical protein